MNETIEFKPIGYIKSPFTSRSHAPAQASQSLGDLVIFEDYMEGIKGLKVGDEITVLFYFHESKSYELTTIPNRHNSPTGLFNTRSPDRPNGIGITVVEITNVKDNIVSVKGVDMLSGTPILDIKPYLRKSVKLTIR